MVRGLRTLGVAAAGLIPAIAAAQQPEPRVAVGGVVYAQYLYQLGDTAAHLNNFDVTRAYVNVTGQLGKGLASRVTSDLHREADGSLALRLKYAYLAWTPKGSPLTVRAGETQTPWLDFEETLWDYRMQGPVPLDREGYLTSSDFGLAVDGTWGHDAVNLSAGVFNGEGYSKTPGDRRKDLEGRVSVRLLATDDRSRTGGLRLSLYGGVGKPTGGGLRNRYVALASYRSKLLTLAAELALTRDRLDNPPAPATPSTTATHGRLASAFAVLRIPRSRFGVIGRVDVVDRDTGTPNDRLTRSMGGVSFQATPNLRLLADVEHTSYQGGAPNPAAFATRTQGLAQAQVVF